MLRATTSCNCSSLIWPAGSARRFSEPTFRHAGATNHWKKEKHSVSRLSYLFAPLDLLSSVTLSLLWSSLFCFSLLSDSSLLCFLSVHIVGSLTSKLPSIILWPTRLKDMGVSENVALVHPPRMTMLIGNKMISNDSPWKPMKKHVTPVAQTELFIYIYIYISKYVCVNIYIYIKLFIYIYICIYDLYIFTYIYIYAIVNLYINIYNHIYTLIYLDPRRHDLGLESLLAIHRRWVLTRFYYLQKSYIYIYIYICIFYIFIYYYHYVFLFEV